MQPIYNANNQDQAPKRTFIEQARRTQIIDATIDVLAEHGYMNTSFVRIAKQANISPSLISYHFKDKEELTNEVVGRIYTGRLKNMQAQIAGAVTATDKLRLALESDIRYVSARPQLFKAMIEVIFSVRDDDGHLPHMNDTDDPGLTIIFDILKAGQASGEFGDFDAYYTALIIDGTRDQFLAQLPTRPSLKSERFTKALIDMALNTVKKDTI